MKAEVLYSVRKSKGLEFATFNVKRFHRRVTLIFHETDGEDRTFVDVLLTSQRPYTDSSDTIEEQEQVYSICLEDERKLAPPCAKASKVSTRHKKRNDRCASEAP